MYKQNTLKQKLDAGKNVYGTWSVLGSPFIMEILGASGFDYVIIDHEHGVGDLGMLAHQLMALDATDTAALVRVPGIDGNYIRRVLDLGVQGVVVPSINSASEARAVVDSCRYPPLGKRGVGGGMIRASGFGAHGQQYTKTANDQVLVICQIETVEGVQNAEEICAVPGIDMIFIGPYDLAASAGLQGETTHPKVLDLIAQTERAVKAAGKPLGSVPHQNVQIKDMHKAGYQLIAAGADSGRLRSACVSEIARYRADMAE